MTGSSTTITVRGEFSAWYPAERATVSAWVHADGPDRDAVYARAVESADFVQHLISDIHDPETGPITWWTSDRVRIWSERPWNQEGKQLAPVHHAAVDFSAKFRDFVALADWFESAAAIDAVTVGGIAWDVTDTTRTAATDEVRTRAVQDAAAKAAVFAHAIGLTTVTPVAIADPGMLGDGGAPGAGFVSDAVMMKSQRAGGSAGLELKPEEIAVSCAVDARFSAS